jgi:hypothetical protein
MGLRGHPRDDDVPEPTEAGSQLGVRLVVLPNQLEERPLRLPREPFTEIGKVCVEHAARTRQFRRNARKSANLEELKYLQLDCFWATPHRRRVEYMRQTLVDPADQIVAKTAHVSSISSSSIHVSTVNTSTV